MSYEYKNHNTLPSFEYISKQLQQQHCLTSILLKEGTTRSVVVKKDVSYKVIFYMWLASLGIVVGALLQLPNIAVLTIFLTVMFISLCIKFLK